MIRFSSLAGATTLVLAVSAVALGERDSGGIPWKQVNLVRLHTSVAGARAVGVFAACDDKIAPEECAFTVESVRYTMGGSAAGSTKFDAICIDIGFPEGAAADAWNCSPVTLEGLAVSVDAGAAGAVLANGGVNTGSTSGVGSNGEVSLGLGVALPLSRRLEVPMARHASSDRPTVRLGGNILMESRIGPVAAGQTLVFGHTSFDGVVTFMVTRPASMTLSIGYVNTAGATSCKDAAGGVAACSPALDRALRSACELSAGGSCSSTAGDVSAPTTAFGQTIDVAELRASLEDQQGTIATVNSDLKEKLPDKVTEVFELLESDEGDEGSAAALPRLGIFNKVKSHFQNKVLPKLQEIKETVQKQVNCPS